VKKGKREAGGGRRDERRGAGDAGVTLQVWIQPRASRTEIVGQHGDAVKIRVAAPPVDGAANDELVRFLAGQYGVPRSAVTITSGATGRRKTIVIRDP
jgi:uncharacterized protein (TIGR00251 family)